MSPVIRLHTYPPDDSDFASGVNLEIDVPEGSPLVELVLGRLKGRYPQVAIRVDPGDDTASVWHVYRDGLPI